MRRSLTLTALSQPDAIGRLSGKAQSAAYAYASAAAFYINDRFGRRKLLRLYDAFNREALAGEGPELADQAVRAVLGMPLTRLERDLRRWIVTRAVVDSLRAVATDAWRTNPAAPNVADRRRPDAAGSWRARPGGRVPAAARARRSREDRSGLGNADAGASREETGASSTARWCSGWW